MVFLSRNVCLPLSTSGLPALVNVKPCLRGRAVQIVASLGAASLPPLTRNCRSVV